MPNVLVVDDARDVAEVVAFGVRMNWPDARVAIANDGNQALLIFEGGSFDIVVLDVSMPPPDGFAVLQQIRERSTVPVLMLTVRDDVLDKVRALDLGADDYLTKPFDHLELLARLRALFRRASQTSPSSTASLTSGDLSIDFSAHEVRLRGEVIRLTTTEYRLLAELAQNAGTLLSHRYLLEHVWGPEYVSEPGYLKVFIRRLRQKLDDDAEHPRYIQTEWGSGYCFISLR